MVEGLSLKELQAENEAEESESAVVDDDYVEVDPETNEAIEPVVEDEEEGEAEGEEEEESPWMQGDDSDVTGTTMPVAAHVNMRRTLKEKVSARDAEIEELRRQNAELQQQRQQAPAPGAAPMPKLEDFAFDDAAHAAATQAWIADQVAAQVKTTQQTSHQAYQQQQMVAQTEKNVNAHYVRAAELAKKSKIAPEVYQQADVQFRAAIDEVFPDRGDLIAEQFIARMGPGSEKVAFHIGRNAKVRAEMQQHLAQDPSGMSALFWLGKQVERVNKPPKKRSGAPRPTPVVTGDTVMSGDASKAKRAYDKAHASGDATKAWDLRSKAKKAGVNTKQW